MLCRPTFQQIRPIQSHRQISIIDNANQFNNILETFDESSIDTNLESNYLNASSIQHDIGPIELDDDIDIQSLPEVMKFHFHHEPHPFTTQQFRDEPISSCLTTTTKTLTAKQIRNRKVNRRHRTNRYRYEVIRDVYERFTITKIKRILKSMNIFYVNINKVRNRLFIGLKNQSIVEEVETLLHSRMFTKHHYERLYR